MQMLNKRPIFINAFSRGGSNIFWNMFLTHPEVCSPIVETLDIFRIGRHGRWSGYQAALLTMQPHFFDQKNLHDRKRISDTAARYIDKTLYEWKLKTYGDEEMRHKNEREVYTLDEIRQSRLVAKNNNGLTFLTDRFLEMYPDATFFALTRHPLALFEGYKRRKFVESVEEFISFYTQMVRRMQNDAQRIERYHVIRFEDVLRNFKTVLHQVYTAADLDITQIDKVRFKAKSHFTADGSREVGYEVGQHYWMPIDEVNAFLEGDINKYQIDRLSESEKSSLRRALEPLMQSFDYAWETA
jgi:hypothetical protein